MTKEAYEDTYFLRDIADFDKLLPHQRFILRLIRKRIATDGSLKVLDIGCGSGTLLYFLKKRLGCDVYGIDIDETAIIKGMENLGIKNLYAYSIKGFIEQNPSMKFDAIIFTELLEHLDDPADFINDIKGILNPNGHIIISVPNRERTVNSEMRTDRPPHHLTKWNKYSLEKFLNSNGFNISYIAIPSFSISSSLSNILFSRYLHTGILTKASKDIHNIGKLRVIAKIGHMRNVVFEGILNPLVAILQGLGCKGSRIVAIAKPDIK